MTTTKPTIVIVHGAWHVPAHYSALTNALQSLSYTVHPPLLPSCAFKGDPRDASLRHDVSVEQDGAVLRSLLLPLLDAGEEVILVLHSYAGLPGTQASAGLSVSERQARGEKGGVLRLVYLAAFLHAEGVPVNRLSGYQVPPIWELTPAGALLAPPDNQHLFYQHGKAGVPDVSDADVEAAKKLLVPHSNHAQSTSATQCGWRTIPSTYVYSVLDPLIPVEYQERMVAEVKAEGVEVDEVRCQTAHSMWMVPGEEGLDKTVQAIVSAAGGK